MRSRSIALVAASFALAALAFAPAALAGGGCHPSGDAKPVAATGASLTVRIDGCIFLPAIDRVPVGTRVTFTNSSLTPHDVSGADYAWRSPMLEPGDSFAYTFPAPGLYPYSCSLHPGMAGVIEVVAEGDAAGLATNPAGPEPPSDTAGALAPLAAGGFGLAVGAILVTLIGRRREREL